MFHILWSHLMVPMSEVFEDLDLLLVTYANSHSCHLVPLHIWYLWLWAYIWLILISGKPERLK